MEEKKVILNFNSIFETCIDHIKTSYDTSILENDQEFRNDIQDKLQDKLNSLEHILQRETSSEEDEKINAVHIRTILSLFGYKICY